MDLDHFICPASRNSLHLENDLLCDGNVSYPMVRGIPRFVPAENYASAFGLQWNVFRRTQLDSYTGTDITETRLQTSLGRPLEGLAGKKVLEAGSGAGRFTEVLLKYGAEVYSFDFSDAVDSNYANNMPNERLTIFQADIRSIPFADNSFDAVLCLGVLQHTPSTSESLSELYRVLKPGGQLVTDHYKWHLGAFTSLYLPWWFLLKRFKPDRQLRITNKLTDVFFPIHWRLRKSRVAQTLLRRVSPINFYYGRFPLSRDHLYQWSKLDTHDRNTDHFKRHVTKRGLQCDAGSAWPERGRSFCWRHRLYRACSETEIAGGHLFSGANAKL